jgi:5-formyltetrahydrofolate cyclo-ligase
MPLTKPELRKLIDAKRKQLDESAIALSDRRVMQNLLSLAEYRQAKTIFCFVGTPAEIATKPITDSAAVFVEFCQYFSPPGVSGKDKKYVHLSAKCVIIFYINNLFVRDRIMVFKEETL